MKVGYVFAISKLAQLSFAIDVFTSMLLSVFYC